MRRQAQMWFGGALVLLGVLYLLGTIFNFDVGSLLCPSLLIVIGIWIVVRPRQVPAGMGIQVRPLGDIRYRGDWQVTDKEIWAGISDIDLDLTRADVPQGETKIRVFSFVGDIDLLVPEGIGVSVSAASFVNEIRLFGEPYGGLLSPVDFATEGYEQMERKVKLEVYAFVNDLKVEQV